MQSIRHTERTDGSTIEWTLTHRNNRSRQGILVLIQGGGCAPSSTSEALSLAPRVAPNLAVLTVEPYGVSNIGPQPTGEAGSRAACSEEYWKHHTISQRVSDFRQVLGEVTNGKWFNGDLILLGGSEGGAIAARLAPDVPDTDAVILFSTSLGQSMNVWLPNILPPPVARQAIATFDDIRERPESDEIFLGNSFRWWADTLDVDYTEHLLHFNGPILLIQGERDEAGGVAPGRTMRDRFISAGRSNLTYIEKPGLNHSMTDSAGANHWAEVFDEAGDWLMQRISD